MSKLDTSAELIKLSRLLRRPEADVSFLAELPLPALIELRQHTSNLFFNDGKKLFQNLASASKLLPAGITAVIAEKAFGPMLCARIAGEMPWQRAVDLSQKMSIPFLADVCTEIDPRRVADILQNMPQDRILAVALELLKRKDYLVMGQFVNLMLEKQLAAIVPHVPEEALLHTGFYVEGKHQLSNIMRLLPESRLRKLVVIMQQNQQLWPEALAMMVHLEDDLKRLMGDLAVEQDEAMLDDLAQTVQRLDLWKDALPLLACMSTSLQLKLVNRAAMQDTVLLRSVVDNADRFGLWSKLLPLVEFMTTGQRQTIAQTIAERGVDLQTRIIRAAASHHIWPPVFDMAVWLPEAAKEQILQVFRELATHRADLVPEWKKLAEDRGLTALFTPL